LYLLARHFLDHDNTIMSNDLNAPQQQQQQQRQHQHELINDAAQRSSYMAYSDEKAFSRKVLCK
jgi:hypothetical protein